MKKAKREKEVLTITYIHWFDSSYQRGEATPDELSSIVHLHSAGVLVKDDEKSVAISLDKYCGDNTHRHIMRIPKVNIVHRKDFKLERPKSK